MIFVYFFISVILSDSVSGAKNNAHMFSERYCCNIDFILESVKKLEELFIAPTARQILHETAQRAFARCECA